MQAELEYSTGNKIVDQMMKIELTGNIVPPIWAKTICYENGKPNWNAINILSDIVYWYRPTEIRDEVTGNFVGYRKKFKADYLQRNYRQICDTFQISKSQARVALECLVNLGVVIKHLRDIQLENGTCIRNVMFLELVPSRLYELTYPRKRMGVVQSNTPHGTVNCTTVEQSNVLRHTVNNGTNTKNTTENIIGDYNPIHLKMQKDNDLIEAYTDLIKENICYDILIQNCEEGEKRIVEELLGIIIEVIVVDKEYIQIGKEKYAYQLVKSQFLKIRYDHIRYVLSCLKRSTTKVNNIKAYLLMVLYNAPNTMDSFYQFEVNYDLYGVD